MSNVIGACGFIATGSSLVSDYLKEFDENQVFDKFEFKLAYQTDGLQDLRHQLFDGCMKYENGLYALQRFLKSCHSYPCREYNKMTNNNFKKYADDFVSNIVQGEWIGLGCDPVTQPYRHFYIRLLKKLGFVKKHHELELRKGKDIDVFPFRKIYFSIKPENFIFESQKLTNSIFYSMGWNGTKNIVLDQPFAGNNPQAAFDFYTNPKAIVIDRDPRDYFVHCNIISYFKGWRQNPINNVESFVILYKKMRENMPYLNNDNRILRIRFEDMIYNYEETTALINKFCGLERHIYPRKYFNPDHSINNTQLYKRYPKFSKEIEYIENQLPEYLYDFEKYADRKLVFGDPFSENILNPVGKKWKG